MGRGTQGRFLVKITCGERQILLGGVRKGKIENTRGRAANPLKKKKKRDKKRGDDYIYVGDR